MATDKKKKFKVVFDTTPAPVDQVVTDALITQLMVTIARVGLRTNRISVNKERNISEHIIDEAMQEVLESFDISDEQLKSVKKSIFEAVTELQDYEHKSIKKLQQDYDKLTVTIGNALKEKLTGESKIDDDTYNELISKWQEEKRNISNQIANLSESTKDTITRMNILADFANRVPELYLKAKLDEKRMILATITESITINAETETITVRLRPVFEHLRLAKESFNADLKTLDGTLQTRSDRAKQALQNIRPDVNDLVDYGTRKKLLNTKIEPNFDGSIEFNVDGGGLCLSVGEGMKPEPYSEGMPIYRLNQ